MTAGDLNSGKIDAAECTQQDGAAEQAAARPDGRNASSQPELAVTCSSGRPSAAEVWDRAVANSRDTWLFHRYDVVRAFTPSDSMPPIFLECRLGGDLVGGAILAAKVGPWHGRFKRKTVQGAARPVVDLPVRR